jgi:hypothetical protein
MNVARDINMGPPRLFFEQVNNGLEVFSLLIIIISCIWIFYKTKELQKLSSHKGIIYFRRAFLFFGISFLIIFYNFVQRIIIGQGLIPADVIFNLYIYFNLVAILYLLLSLIWKFFDQEFFIYLISFIIVTLGRGFFQGPEFMILLQIFLGLVFSYLILTKFKQTKTYQQKQMLIIYILLVIFWILSGVGLRFTHILQIDRDLIPIIKAAIFLFIVFKINKRLKQ